MSDSEDLAQDDDALMLIGTTPLLRAFLMTGIVLFTSAILYLGASVIVPVVEAVVIWFVLNALTRGLQRVPYVGGYLPYWAALLISTVFVFVFGLMVVRSTIETFTAMGQQAMGLQEAFDPAVQRVADLLGMDANDLFSRTVDSLRIEAALGQIVVGMLSLVSHFSVVAIYVGFLLVDQQFFDAKLRALIANPARREQTRAVMGRLGKGIQTYLLIMSMTSFLTSTPSYLILLSVGAEHAFFLASTIFILNFIPTIGSIIGTVMPTVFVLAQMQAFEPTVFVLLGISLVQFLVGNILLPRLSSGSLNISIFVTVLALFVFGALWGVTGMFVAMPLTSMLVIVFGTFPATRPIAILLSRTGKIDAETPVDGVPSGAR